MAKGGMIHLINSGATTLDGTGQATDSQGNPTMKHHWELTDADTDKMLKATTWYPANRDYFRGGGFKQLPQQRRNACDHGSPQPRQRTLP